MEKKVTRIYTGPDGESHFEDITVPWSKITKATGIMFQELVKYSDWHNAPRRQFIFTLEGEAEMEIGDGTKRRFRRGDILLAEDTTGHGHLSRVVGNQPRKTITVTLD